MFHKLSLKKESIQYAAEHLRDAKFPCSFLEENKEYLNYIDASVEKRYNRLNLKLPEVYDLSRAGENEVFQLWLSLPEEQEYEILRDMPEIIGARWHPDFIDIMPADGGKHIGMQKTLEYFGIKREECMAIGDGENDITMLKFAGTGVAMGNADEQVKSAADYVTSSVDEDGIWNTLMHFGIIAV